MPKMKIIRRAGKVNSKPVIWSLKASFLKAFALLVELSVLLDSIAPQKSIMCWLVMTAIASIQFYLIFY